MNRILFPMKSKFAIDVEKLINDENNKIYYYGLEKDSKGIDEFYDAKNLLSQVYYSRKKFKFKNKLKIRNFKKYNFFKNLFEVTSNRVFIDEEIKKKKICFMKFVAITTILLKIIKLHILFIGQHLIFILIFLYFVLQNY